MDLKQFVKDALVEIAEGVREAQKVSGDARINPHNMNIGVDVMKKSIHYESVCAQLVEFDVALTVSSTTGGDGKISVLGMSLGGGTQDSSSTATRVKFSVPVLLPSVSPVSHSGER